MCCEHLVCAACAGPVSEGRCATCRTAKAQVHQAGPLGLPPQVVALLAALVVLVSALLAAVPR